VLVTYHPGIEQLLVLLPPTVAATEAFGPTKNPTGLPMGDFALTVSDPPACTVGFLPPSQWRSPADTTTIDTPDNLYCKLPQDSPINVRGARNLPCMKHPGKRAPTVEICDSNKPFEPLAMRPHALGPAPFDPNTIAQGVPPDDRTNFGNQIFAPTEGTPMPPGPRGQPASTPQLPSLLTPAGPAGEPPPPSPPWAPLDVPSAAPSGFVTHARGPGPTVAVAEYNPKTGMYISPDSHAHKQTNLVTPGSRNSWQDMLPT
jgi:phospholipid/cholesterol/gamma-HCH transport system substrate-binding protein